LTSGDIFLPLFRQFHRRYLLYRAIRMNEFNAFEGGEIKSVELNRFAVGQSGPFQGSLFAIWFAS
jgi:hypothetical protein